MDIEEGGWVRVMSNGTPVRHCDLADVVGVVCGHFWERGMLYYLIDWLVEGFAPHVTSTCVRELPSEMHLLASV